MEPVEFRRRLHAHPELSFKEHATAAFIEQQLDELGIEHRRIASTGVVARIKGRKTPEGDRRAAVLRAEEITMTCVTAPDDPHARDRAIDRIVLSRRFGIPLMLLLLALVLAALSAFSRLDKAAGRLLMPYAAWLLFAAYLNYSMMRMA